MKPIHLLTIECSLTGLDVHPNTFRPGDVEAK